MAACALVDILSHLRERVVALERSRERAPVALTGDGAGAFLGAPARAHVELLDDDGKPMTSAEAAERPKHHVIRGGKLYNINADTLRVMLERNNMYWATQLKVDRIDFRISKEDFAYTTLSDTALYRNTYLSSFFVNPPVVVDCYAGVGMDTISFMHNLMFTDELSIKKIYAVENNDDDDRNGRLIHNVQEYIRARDKVQPGALVPAGGDGLQSQIEFYLNGTELFFQNCRHFKKNAIEEIDLLYIDPPWTLPGKENKGLSGEATPMELLRFLFDTVFKHLIDSKIKVKVVCIKTRFKWEQCAPFIEMLSNYIQDERKRFAHVTTLSNKPFKNVYYFHVIKTVEAEYGEWHQSGLFKKTYGVKPRVTQNGEGGAVDEYQPPNDKYERPVPGARHEPDVPYRPGRDPMKRGKPG
jgi:hypothetical protein